MDNYLSLFTLLERPLATNYTFKVFSLSFWRGDLPSKPTLHTDLDHVAWNVEDGPCGIGTMKVQTEEDVLLWIRKFNSFHEKYVSSSNGYVLRRTGNPVELIDIPCNLRLHTTYYVVAQTSADKKDWDGMPNGIYFYPKDNYSKTECEQIVEELRADQEKIKQMKDPVIYRESLDYGVVTFGVMERENL